MSIKVSRDVVPVLEVEPSLLKLELPVRTRPNGIRLLQFIHHCLLFSQEGVSDVEPGARLRGSWVKTTIGTLLKGASIHPNFKEFSDMLRAELSLLSDQYPHTVIWTECDPVKWGDLLDYNKVDVDAAITQQIMEWTQSTGNRACTPERYFHLYTLLPG